jgi:hypothetical protein
LCVKIDFGETRCYCLRQILSTTGTHMFKSFRMTPRDDFTNILQAASA